MIVLSACDLKFKWQFPQKTTQCPVKNCRKQFGVRSDAIVHYKKFHAERSTLCPACKEPKMVRKLSDIAYHYSSVHPNENLPSFFGKPAQKKNLNNEQVNVKLQMKHFQTKLCHENGCPLTNVILLWYLVICKFVFILSLILGQREVEFSCWQRWRRKITSSVQYFVVEWISVHRNHLSVFLLKDGDMIVLSGCGLKFMWQYPRNIKKCPVRNCLKLFDTRSDAIIHFKRNHAKRSTLCSICQGPILMRTFGDINHHYKRRHPNADVPSYFVKKNIDADVQPQMESFKSKSHAENGSQPLKEMHKKARLSCPLKSCSYETMQMTELCTHWTKNHGELQFPEFRGEKRFTYVADTQKPAIQRKVYFLRNLKIREKSALLHWTILTFLCVFGLCPAFRSIWYWVDRIL